MIKHLSIAFGILIIIVIILRIVLWIFAMAIDAVYRRQMEAKLNAIYSKSVYRTKPEDIKSASSGKNALFRDRNVEMAKAKEVEKKRKAAKARSDDTGVDVDVEIDEQALEEGLVAKYDPSGKEVKDDTRIVGLAEPKGLWSKLIMSQRMQTLLKRVGMDFSHRKFWTNLVNAQKQGGMDKGRGR